MLVHLAAIAELPKGSDPLPPDMARALYEDLEYARLGAVLPDLPIFEGVRGSVGLASMRREPPPMAQTFHRQAPMRLGLKLAELVANGALVGHEPDIGQLASKLLGMRRAIEFRKGAVCRIDVDGLPPGGPGRLAWFATPRMLRRMAP